MAGTRVNRGQALHQLSRSQQRPISRFSASDDEDESDAHVPFNGLRSVKDRPRVTGGGLAPLRPGQIPSGGVTITGSHLPQQPIVEQLPVLPAPNNGMPIASQIAGAPGQRGARTIALDALWNSERINMPKALLQMTLHEDGFLKAVSNVLQAVPEIMSTPIETAIVPRASGATLDQMRVRNPVERGVIVPVDLLAYNIDDPDALAPENVIGMLRQIVENADRWSTEIENSPRHKVVQVFCSKARLPPAYALAIPPASEILAGQAADIEREMKQRLNQARLQVKITAPRTSKSERVSFVNAADMRVLSRKATGKDTIEDHGGSDTHSNRMFDMDVNGMRIVRLDGSEATSGASNGWTTSIANAQLQNDGRTVVVLDGTRLSSLDVDGTSHVDGTGSRDMWMRGSSTLNGTGSGERRATAARGEAAKREAEAVSANIFQAAMNPYTLPNLAASVYGSIPNAGAPGVLPRASGPLLPVEIPGLQPEAPVAGPAPQPGIDMLHNTRDETRAQTEARGESSSNGSSSSMHRVQADNQQTSNRSETTRADSGTRQTQNDGRSESQTTGNVARNSLTDSTDTRRDHSSTVSDDRVRRDNVHTVQFGNTVETDVSYVEENAAGGVDRRWGIPIQRNTIVANERAMIKDRAISSSEGGETTLKELKMYQTVEGLINTQAIIEKYRLLVDPMYTGIIRYTPTFLGLIRCAIIEISDLSTELRRYREQMLLNENMFFVHGATCVRFAMLLADMYLAFGENVTNKGKYASEIGNVANVLSAEMRAYFTTARVLSAKQYVLAQERKLLANRDPSYGFVTRLLSGDPEFRFVCIGQPYLPSVCGAKRGSEEVCPTGYNGGHAYGGEGRLVVARLV